MEIGEAEISKVTFVQIGKKFCTTLYKLHRHKMSSGRHKDRLVRSSGRLDSKTKPLKHSFNQGEGRNYAGCVFILVGEDLVDFHLWMEFVISPRNHEKNRSIFVLVGEIFEDIQLLTKTAISAGNSRKNSRDVFILVGETR